MKLVISEKPSVGMSIASVLGANKRCDGYMEGDEYIVSWCFGHLAGLASCDVYNEKYIKWRYDDLPIKPDPWQFTVGKDKQAQFNLLKKLMNRADVTEVINACDAGREGELIFRNVYTLARCTKPIKRLWISSMEDSAIRQGFTELRSGDAYDNLYRSALCRAKADWLVGINATRLFSVLYRQKLNVGRVVSPTLALIVQRETEIDSFKSEQFYTVNLDFSSFTAASERISDKLEVERITGECTGKDAVVRSVERKEKSENPPLLYDLTTLQRNANRLLGYTAQQTLNYLQSLYEKKLCTYPRTDSRYLTDDMESKVSVLISYAAEICGSDVPPITNSTQVCNSKKVSDHHAVIVTSSVAKADIESLPAGEREILRLVCSQMLMAVCGAYKYTETTIVIDCAGYTFTAKSKTVVTSGWKAYTKDQSEKSLPELNNGAVIGITSVSVKEGKTTPLKHYTEDTLLSAMEIAGAKEAPDDAERKGLGTPATRAAILEKLVLSGFVERKKAQKTVNLIPTHSAYSLITVLPEQLQSPLLTAEWEYRLKQIERGELSDSNFMDGISDMVTELVLNYCVIKGAEVLFPSGNEVVGKCPRCCGNVTESKKGFFCENPDCRFALWRDSKYFTAKKISLTTKLVSALLKDRCVHLTGIYSEKTGKTYDASIIMEDDGERTSFKLDFDKEKK